MITVERLHRIMAMTDNGLFDTTVHDGIAKGSCVMIHESSIVFAGPLNHAPDADGRMILLHREDFDELALHIDARRH